MTCKRYDQATQDALYAALKRMERRDLLHCEFCGGRAAIPEDILHHDEWCPVHQIRVALRMAETPPESALEAVVKANEAGYVAEPDVIARARRELEDRDAYDKEAPDE